MINYFHCRTGTSCSLYLSVVEYSKIDRNDSLKYQSSHQSAFPQAKKNFQIYVSPYLSTDESLNLLVLMGIVSYPLFNFKFENQKECHKL